MKAAPWPATYSTGILSRRFDVTLSCGTCPQGHHLLACEPHTRTLVAKGVLTHHAYVGALAAGTQCELCLGAERVLARMGKKNVAAQVLLGCLDDLLTVVMGFEVKGGQYDPAQF